MTQRNSGPGNAPSQGLLPPFIERAEVRRHSLWNPGAARIPLWAVHLTIAGADRADILFFLDDCVSALRSLSGERVPGDPRAGLPDHWCASIADVKLASASFISQPNCPGIRAAGTVVVNDLAVRAVFASVGKGRDVHLQRWLVSYAFPRLRSERPLPRERESALLAAIGRQEEEIGRLASQLYYAVNGLAQAKAELRRAGIAERRRCGRRPSPLGESRT